MKTLRIFSISLLILLLSAELSGQDYKYLNNKSGLSEITANNGIDKPVTVKVVYDNYVKVDLNQIGAIRLSLKDLRKRFFLMQVLNLIFLNSISVRWVLMLGRLT
jgi:hypothetical protein